MCGFGGGSKNSAPAPVAPPPPPPVPTPQNTVEQTAGARAAERKRAALAAGRDSTILTGAQGDLTQANTKQKTLLGA